MRAALLAPITRKSLGWSAGEAMQRRTGPLQPTARVKIQMCEQGHL